MCRWRRPRERSLMTDSGACCASAGVAHVPERLTLFRGVRLERQAPDARGADCHLCECACTSTREARVVSSERLHQWRA